MFLAWLWIATGGFGFGTENFSCDRMKGIKEWCWGPSASEGPQKHDLTVFLEYNVWTGIFGLESEREKLKRYEGWHSAEAVKQESFGMFAEKGTDSKMKRPFRPR
jgi:hypothetical protein